MKKYRIGIEINDKELNLAVVAKQRIGWVLLDTMTLPITSNSIPQILQGARRHINRSIRHTVLSLPHHQVLMKDVRVDSSLSDGETYQYLQQQATFLFGKPYNHWVIDFEPAIFANALEQQICLRVIATPREKVINWLQFCNGGGFEVCAVDVDILALVRLASTFEGYQTDKSQALLWLKETELVLIAFKATQLIYAKTTAYSSAQSLIEIWTSLLQFYNGMFPENPITSVFLLTADVNACCETLTLKTAALDSTLWKTHNSIQPQEFCSLGLAIYGN